MGDFLKARYSNELAVQGISLSRSVAESLYSYCCIQNVMGRIAWLRAKANTDLGWLLLALLAPLSILISLAAWRNPDMASLLNYSFNPLLAAAAINTIITIIVAYLGLAQKRGKDKVKELLDNLTKRCENKEMDLLIKPIYLAFDKYPEAPNVQTREKFGYPMIWSLMSHPSDKSQKFLHIEKADPVIDVFQQHGNLAQPELRELIRQYLEFRGRHKKNRINEHDEYFEKTVKIVERIELLVKKRYEELMWWDKRD